VGNEGRAVDYEGDADYLIMTIYLLFSLCCMRIFYLSMPESDQDMPVVGLSCSEPWNLLFQMIVL
jgi:hypothetical protein